MKSNCVCSEILNGKSWVLGGVFGSGENDIMQTESESERPEFSVCQFFVTGEYEYVRRYVTARKAVEAARHYTDSVAAKIGVVDRVIITDGGDCTVFEWLFGKGVTYPTKEMRKC
jgi:hypothetical protein